MMITLQCTCLSRWIALLLFFLHKPTLLPAGLIAILERFSFKCSIYCGGASWRELRTSFFTHLQVLAEALLGFIDHDRNGKIEGGELKVRCKSAESNGLGDAMEGGHRWAEAA